MPQIFSATRSIPKATYVTLQLSGSNQQTNSQNHNAASVPQKSGALLKYGYVRQLALQPGEVDKALTGSPTFPQSLVQRLRPFEGSPVVSSLPAPADFAQTPTADLLKFGQLLVAFRQQQTTQQPAAGNAVSTANSYLPPSASGIASAFSTHLLNAAVVATKAFETNSDSTLLGTLHLERLEMTPAGLERGELVATIPLAPMEETAVVQKEWSVTSAEFTSIVTDSLENYSETGVTDSTELTQSTTSQSTRNNQFNATGSAQGGFGSFFTASASTGLSIQDQATKSATDSRKDAMQLTKKASSRSKQSHKITISTQTTSGSSQTSTRSLKNPSATDPMRIDYFSLMRKWHVGLYRYGIRLTYDVVIPEPGAVMRKLHKELLIAQQTVQSSFTFLESFEEINPASLSGLADRYQVALPDAPGPSTNHYSLPTNVGDDDDSWHYFDLPVPVGARTTT